MRLGRGRMVSVFKKSDRDGSYQPDLDIERSVYPWGSGTSGKGIANLGSVGYFDSVLNNLSKKRLLLREVAIANTGGANMVVFYDGQSGSAGLVTLPMIHVKASDTVFWNPKDGIILESGLYASNVDSGIQIRANALMISSGPA